MTEPEVKLPTVVVHGLWDNVRRIAPLVDGLVREGVVDVHAIELKPASGRAPIEVLATQLSDFVAALQRARAVSQVDVVGFSMGALVTRTYLQLQGGSPHVRTFVSISGPHAGTWTAYASPPSLRGARQMRPGSALLARLGTDVGHLTTAVHCLYTPYDAMVVPPSTAILAGARSVHRVPVPMHRRMLHDRRVHRMCAELLGY